MRIIGLIWLEVIEDKLAIKHHVMPDEVEQVFANRPQYRFLERGKIEGEDVYAAYGCTNAWAILDRHFHPQAWGTRPDHQCA